MNIKTVPEGVLKYNGSNACLVLEEIVNSTFQGSTGNSGRGEGKATNRTPPGLLDNNGTDSD